MSNKTPGAGRTDGEAVAEVLMDAKRQVKIFIEENGPWGLDNEINQWLDTKPGIEILEFFPVSVATAVALSMAKAATDVAVTMGNSAAPGSPMVDRDNKEKTVAAVGIYYLER